MVIERLQHRILAKLLQSRGLLHSSLPFNPIGLSFPNSLKFQLVRENPPLYFTQPNAIGEIPLRMSLQVAVKCSLLLNAYAILQISSLSS